MLIIHVPKSNCHKHSTGKNGLWENSAQYKDMTDDLYQSRLKLEREKEKLLGIDGYKPRDPNAQPTPKDKNKNKAGRHPSASSTAPARPSRRPAPSNSAKAGLRRASETQNGLGGM